MAKLICFPHYTCGGLICDILNDTFSAVGSNGGISSFHHSLGKIGDNSAVFADFDVAEFMRNLPDLPKQWLGTHCWSGRLPLDQFEQVINITTTTYKSQAYRWVRTYHHYYVKTWPALSGMELQDKLRCTAKNYLIPFEAVEHQCVYNIEFADIVEDTQEFRALVGTADVEKHLDRWKKINNFLYDEKLWSSDLVKALYQAQVEKNLNRPYIYQA